jgi:FAD/FMN-containing dehydrogenase
MPFFPKSNNSPFITFSIMSQVIQEVTHLFPVTVEDVFAPTTVEEIQKILSETKGKISVGWGRYSMGGQTAVEGGIQIDMRKMNHIVDFDKKKKQITVEAGITWRDIQDYIDPHDLSIMTMQTYSNFTVWGSLSVNVHGRYIGFGPIILSVISIRVMLADGSIKNASRDENSDIFSWVIGGYGAIGIIIEATLKLRDNDMLERSHEDMPLDSYGEWFQKNIRDNAKVIFHNADMYPPHFTGVRATSWSDTKKPPTTKERLIPRWLTYPLHKKIYRLMTNWYGPMTHFDYGKWMREHMIDPLVYSKLEVHSRNYEASYDVAELEPKSREKDTYVLEEYFCPVERINDFVPKMREIFQRHEANIINISIRHALPDDGSVLAWAKEEVFAFVVYYNQWTSLSERREVAVWTRELIEAVISVGGRYYLPYQLHGTHTQVERAYTWFETYKKLKHQYDPAGRFSNMLLEKYYFSQPEKEKVLSSRFHTVYATENWRDKFYLFLQNIFHIAPTAILHSAIWDIVEKNKTDERIYNDIQTSLPRLKPALADIRYGIPALKKQKSEMARQAKIFFGDAKIQGYLEIWWAWRYIGPLCESCDISWPIYLISDEPIDFSPVRILERGKFAKFDTKKLSYTPDDFSHIPDNSIDAISIFIGLHHCPKEILDEYIRSFVRKLRKWGHLILRDHNVEDSLMHTFVSIAHDIYNAWTGAPWGTNDNELRNFRSISEWKAMLGEFGLASKDQDLLQKNDPTDNTLMHFIKK